MIYLDACLLIYAIENHPVFAAPVRQALTGAGDEILAISPLVKLECLVHPMADANLELQRYYEAAFNTLTVLDLSEAVFLQAAALRARFGIKTPDALHLACAQHHRCTALWTNDRRLSKASHGLAIAILTS